MFGRRCTSGWSGSAAIVSAVQPSAPIFAILGLAYAHVAATGVLTFDYHDLLGRAFVIIWPTSDWAWL